MAKPLEKQKARTLRSQGKSIKSIAKEIGVSPSTVSRWVKDIQLSETQLDYLKQSQKQWASQNKGAQQNKECALLTRQKFQKTGRIKAREMDFLHMQGCMLYWAEGSKDKNRVEFVNSDVNMMKLFIKFLRKCLSIKDENISLRVTCHSDKVEEIEEIKTFWSCELALPIQNFGKTQLKKGSKSRKNRLKYGVCTIRIDSTEIAQHIFGAIQEYGGFDNPDWLF